MPDQTWFTSDTHFGHDEILPSRMLPRPFADIEEHDEALIANCNGKVRPTDTIYHLGDFALGCTPEHADGASSVSTVARS